MKRIVSVCATFLLIIAGFSLGAQSSGRIVVGQVTHTNSDGSTDGVFSTVQFTSSSSSSVSVKTDLEGVYSATVRPNTRYSCTATNEHGTSEPQELSAGSQQATMNFNF